MLDAPKILAAMPVLLALTACHSDFDSTVQLPEDCDRKWYFEDQDGDGWGRADGNAELRCTADDSPEVRLTARNNLDCDDGPDGGSAADMEAAAAVTGRTAAICPDELVPNGAASHGFAASGSEFAAVLPTLDYSHIGQVDPEGVTTLMWADGAASGCGGTGWGGNLGTFGSLTELTEVTDVLDEFVGSNGYAAWVGLIPNDTRDGWRWEDAGDREGLQVSEVGLCNPDDAPAPSDVVLDPGLRMALVKPAGGDWCFGYPDDANPDDLGDGEFAYQRRGANFICEREPPLSSDFEIDRDPSEG